MDNSNHPVEWFEARVGHVIYRAPIFASEQSKQHIAVKIKDVKHAKLLYELQRPGRPPYEDIRGINEKFDKGFNGYERKIS